LNSHGREFDGASIVMVPAAEPTLVLLARPTDHVLRPLARALVHSGRLAVADPSARAQVLSLDARVSVSELAAASPFCAADQGGLAPERTPPG